MKELENMLDALGLEYQESKVYLQSLSLGTSRASIIAKRCKLPRSTARFTCEQLVEKQLMIESQKGNAKLFTPENPQKLRKLLDLQQEQLKSRGQELDVKMQDLMRLYNPYTVIPKARFYEGVDGLIELVSDVFTEGGPIFGSLSFSEDMHPEALRYLNEVYVPKRSKTGQSSWVIYNDTPMTREYQKMDEKMNRTTLLMPYDKFPFDSCLQIYGNKVAFYSYKRQDMTGVLIENEIIRNTQMSVFKMAWEYAKSLKQNQKYAHVELPD